jgi:hypothetical protein
MASPSDLGRLICHLVLLPVLLRFFLEQQVVKVIIWIYLSRPQIRKFLLHLVCVCIHCSCGNIACEKQSNIRIVISTVDDVQSISLGVKVD